MVKRFWGGEQRCAALRLLCARAGVDMQKVLVGFLSERRDLPSLVQAASVLAESPIYIDDTANTNVISKSRSASPR